MKKKQNPTGYSPPKVETVSTAEVLELLGPAVAAYGDGGLGAP